jgi:hypothetical protein
MCELIDDRQDLQATTVLCAIMQEVIGPHPGWGLWPRMVEKMISSSVRVGFLHQLPILGALFENGTKRKAQTELLIFITPEVLQRERS